MEHTVTPNLDLWFEWAVSFVERHGIKKKGAVTPAEVGVYLADAQLTIEMYDLDDSVIVIAYRFGKAIQMQFYGTTHWWMRKETEK